MGVAGKGSWWPLTPLSEALKRAASAGSNQPSVRDLEAMLSAFVYWKDYYVRDAIKSRERAAKLSLIGDSEAEREARNRDSCEEDAARCDVGIRVLQWAIQELGRK